MNWLLKIGRILAAWGVAFFFVSLSVLLWRTPNILLHVDGTLTRTEATLSKANATLSNLDKGTKVWAASAQDQAKAVDDLALQARGTLSEAQETFSAIPVTLTHIQGTADAATGTLDAATDAVKVTKRTVAKFGPVAESAEIDLDDLDALLKDEAIHRTLQNVQGMTEQGNQILTDARKVADKETADWLRPVPWWKQPIKKGGQLIDITAAIARHTP